MFPERCAEVPDFELPTGGGRGRRVKVTSGDLANIEYLYDIGSESIFAPNYPTAYANRGGIVQGYEIDELIQFLRGR